MHDWELVTSSHVQALSFEVDGYIKVKGLPDDELPAYGTLYVAFHAGTVYSYEGVSQQDFELILSADSVGGALHRLGITNPRGRRHEVVGQFNQRAGDESSP